MAVSVSYKTRKAFLDVVSSGLSDSRAARASATTVKVMKQLAAQDTNFKEDWDDAIVQGLNKLEDKAVSRAMKGSDTLMMFLLKARDRVKYGDQTKLEHSGGIDLSGAKDKLAARLATLAKRRGEAGTPKPTDG